MARQLKHYVSLNDETGKTHTFAPGDTVPAWAEGKLGDHLFEESEVDPEDSQREAFEARLLEDEAKIAADAAADAQDEDAPADDTDGGAAAPEPAEESAVTDFTKPAPRVRAPKK